MIKDLQDVLSTNIKGMRRSAIRELLKYLGQPGLISFSGGFPAPSTFPIEELKGIISEVMDKEAALALQYGTTEGDNLLRTLLVERYKKAGIDMGLENIIITTASQQALDLIAKMFIDRGDSGRGRPPSGRTERVQFLRSGHDRHSDGRWAKTRAWKPRLKAIARGKGKFIYVIPISRIRRHDHEHQAPGSH